MKPKQLLITLFVLIISFASKAQDGQPFKSIGKKVKVLTLSKGKYIEFFDYDTIQHMGTVLYNIRTKKIVRLLNADSVYKKASNNTSASRWYSPDPLADKFASLSPYNFVENNPISKVDPDGLAPEDIIVTTKKGKELFTLDDGKKEITYKTVDQLYKDKTQWFEPLADNYIPLKSINANLGTASEVKHFSWEQIDEFASVDRGMLAYAKNGEGDWKTSKAGAGGYTLSTVNGKPYWSDAIGQIPFAVDNFTDRLEAHGNYDKAIRETVNTGRRYANGIPIAFLNTTDNSNQYDNYFVLRGALYASEKYSVRDGKIYTGPKPYNPSSLGNKIRFQDAIPYLGLKK